MKRNNPYPQLRRILSWSCLEHLKTMKYMKMLRNKMTNLHEIHAACRPLMSPILWRNRSKMHLRHPNVPVGVEWVGIECIGIECSNNHTYRRLKSRHNLTLRWDDQNTIGQYLCSSVDVRVLKIEYSRGVIANEGHDRLTRVCKWYDRVSEWEKAYSRASRSNTTYWIVY